MLAATEKYHIIAPTRNLASSQAKELALLPNVEVVAGGAAGYSEENFSKYAARADIVFINTDGFTLGESLETFWGIRFFELSVRAGVKHFIYSGLDYNGKASNYDPALYVGHYEGKARVQGMLLPLLAYCGVLGFPTEYTGELTCPQNGCTPKERITPWPGPSSARGRMLKP